MYCLIFLLKTYISSIPSTFAMYLLCRPIVSLEEYHTRSIPRSCSREQSVIIHLTLLFTVFITVFTPFYEIYNIIISLCSTFLLEQEIPYARLYNRSYSQLEETCRNIRMISSIVSYIIVHCSLLHFAGSHLLTS